MMMSEMTEAEFWAALSPLAVSPAPTYKLYYDEQGLPLFYSMEDCPGNYIEIDHDTWHNPGNIQVVDGKIVRIKTAVVHKLVPSDVGTACHPQDISIVVNNASPNTKWIVK
jgi:hypothetical protein